MLNLPTHPRSLLRAILAVVVVVTSVVGTGVVGTDVAQAGAPYVGQADVHADLIVFTAENDLWTCDRQGENVRRLTTFVGAEYFPHFSPDGNLIAFTGEYDGNRDVYVIAADGGEPRRLTWHPARDEVIGWQPDGQAVILRSRRTDPHRSSHLYTVAIGGGDAVELPLGWATRLDIDPETGRWAFNRTERERATWKRYRGGTAADIWVGDPQQNDFKQITDFAGPDAFPMWHGGNIYFLSDQGGTANIWRIAPDGGNRSRITEFSEWDARWPAMGPGGVVVFTQAADLHLLDVNTGSVTRLAIELPSDRVLTRTRYPASGRFLTGFDLAPDGERLLVEVRGELFSVPVKEGITLPITRGTGARERAASYGHDGKTVIYYTDETREDALQSKDAWGRGEAKTLRQGEAGPWLYRPLASPDGKWIAWSDSEYDLHIANADGRGHRKIDHGDRGPIRQYVWSPDGRWLAYTENLNNDFSSIQVYDTQTKKTQPVTSHWANDHSPAWDPDGRFLYFVSNRATNPVLGWIDRQNVEVKGEMLYALLLRPDVENPFQGRDGLPPTAEDEKTDEKKDEKKKGDKDDEGEDEQKEAPEPIEIDFDGLLERIVELPQPRGDYGGLAATSSHLYFVSNPLKGMAERPGFFGESEPDAVLMTFSLEDKESQPFVAGITGYDLEATAGKVAVMKKRGELFVVDAGAPPGESLAKGKIDLADVMVELDPRAEWEQAYYDAWRQMRAFYWDPDMGGLDWPEIRDQYATLLPRLSSRADFGDLLGQMYGEVNTSHSYVFGGDPGVVIPRVATGLLGADLVREGDAYRVERILHGDTVDRVRSPLAEPGVEVAAGDFIVAVNRVPVAGAPSLHALLAGLAGKETLLSVSATANGKEFREVMIVPLRSEGPLRYADWVRRNREYVAEKTGGKVGYIHVPDMGKDGMVAFNKWFYPQLDKEAMVVDVRWNGGGFVSQMLVERLRRSVTAFDLVRGGASFTYPDRVLNGPFVVLTNEFAGSDGDIFPQAIQIEGLAPVIGMRSWGGVVGINAIRPLQDGGLVTNPVVAWWDRVSGWGVENHGVDPDIEVQNLPQELAEGVDTQLDRGISEVLELRRQNPPQKPDFGPVPPRTRKAYQDELK